MLLATRQSSRAFDGRLCLKSPTATHLLKERAVLDERLTELKAAIEEKLHPLVAEHYPQVSLRKALLRLKRDVQRERTLHPASLTLVDSLIPRELGEYKALLSRRDTLFKQGTDAIRRDTSAAIVQLREDPLFRKAIAYSAPELSRKLSIFNGLAKGRIADKLSRSLYAYGAKWVSKANPLNYFAGMSFPGEELDHLEERQALLEYQIDVGYLLALEGYLLKERGAQDSFGLSLCPYLETSDRVMFVLGGADSVSLLTLVDNPVLQGMRTYFRETKDTSLAALLGHLGQDLQVAEEKLRRYLALLLERRILKFFLIEDFLGFERQLLQRAPHAQHLCRGLEQFHARTFPLGTLEEDEVRDRLRPEVLQKVALKQPLHLNLYFATHQSPLSQEALEPLLADLSALKPLLTSYHSFSKRAHELSQALAPHFPSGNRPVMTYPQCLVHLVKSQKRLAALDQETVDLHPLAHLAELEGELRPSDLKNLLEKCLPHGLPAQPLTCNGVYDFQSHQFSITNLWNGDGHFLGRYRARERAPRFRTQPEDRHLVQIYDVLGTNKNLVPVLSNTGFSLDRRYRNLFEHWLEPNDILLVQGDTGITYRHRTTGKPIEFLWRGFVLYKGLPAPYQALLLRSPDAYYNPFAGRIAKQGSRYRAPITYGRVVLRRGFWAFNKGELPHRKSDEDLLSYTYRFGRWLALETGESTAYFYYRANTSQAMYKPYFLDVENHQSVAYLLNLLRKMKDHELLTFAKMSPAPEALCPEGNDPFMTELMLEV